MGRLEEGLEAARKSTLDIFEQSVSLLKAARYFTAYVIKTAKVCL